MTGRRGTFLTVAAILLGIAAMFLLWPREPRAGAAASAVREGRGGGAASPNLKPPPPLPEPKVAAAPGDAPSRIAEKLNAPENTARRDLEIVNELLVAWQSNFPREGNPVGENAEITAALTGRNPLQLVLLAPTHPAINAAGELCDRWGTPLRFHQLSGTEMELRSAGPDRKFATPDDVLWPPAK